ncbi:MAG TPA: BatA and WFA domain-containing protein [Chthoniobacterales bacterium]
MSFLLPLFWSALALAIPVTIFYLIREQPRRRLISSLLFWQHADSKVSEAPLWRKLRRWISLLLQLLFLALLVFGLTRPMAKWESLQARARIFILDGSASMRATDIAPNRFEAARSAIRREIRQMRFFDESAVLLAGENPEILSGWTRSKRRLLEALDRAGPATKAADIPAASNLAADLIAARKSPRIEWFSGGVVGTEELPKQKEAAWQWFAGRPENMGLTQLAARRSFVSPGEFTLGVRADAGGESPVDGEIEIFRNGALLDAQSVTLTPGKSWERSWNFTARDGGEFEARLVKKGTDHLEQDNSGKLTVSPLEEISVTLVAPDDSFLAAAFYSMPGVQLARVWPPEKAGSGDPGKVWVFSGATPPENFQARAMILLAPEQGGFWGNYRGELNSVLVSEVNETSPLMRFVSLSPVQAGRALDFQPAAGAEVEAASFGHPLIFGKWKEPFPWLVIGFDLEKSDLVLRAAFPILLANAVQSLRISQTPLIEAEFPGISQTRLVSAKSPKVEREAKNLPGWTNVIGSHPLWWWALLLGIGWIFAEWWAYHRRITE